MDGKGAWRDNVFVERLWRSIKYEEVYLKAYDSVSEARVSDAPLSQPKMLFRQTEPPHFRGYGASPHEPSQTPSALLLSELQAGLCCPTYRRIF
jgi:putative transposase